MSHVHKLTADTPINMLYHGYASGRGFAVDQVFSDNIIKAKEIINIARYVTTTSMVITPSGKLVLTNGYEIQVFSHSAEEL